MQGRTNEAIIWYMYHSGFAVKTSNHLLIFDYYLDRPGSRASANASILQEMHNRDVIVFASHGHADHFTPTILEWENRNQRIKYVLSHDIELGKGRQEVTIVYPGHKYQVSGVEIEVLESTDMGVAFLVSCDDLRIFHAGDLNWWRWKGEPDEENSSMAENYKKQIDLLKGKQIDIAFIPVDPRLEEYYSLGLVYFMQAVGAEMVFPMHFGMNYSVFQRLKNDISSAYLKHIVEIAPSNWQFTFKRHSCSKGDTL
ncbi:MAG: putative metal dependent hydrolase [Bacillota bacterium]|nr:MAG: putative metal dependent hydrolase [Bacillota bacterium]MBS3951189.1 MBL fold metallo-hydrolase [Peptococcaceae bacterium]